MYGQIRPMIMAQDLPKQIDGVLIKHQEELLQRLEAWLARLDDSLRSRIDRLDRTDNEECEDFIRQYGPVKAPTPPSPVAESEAAGVMHDSSKRSIKRTISAVEYESAKEEAHRVGDLKRIIFQEKAAQHVSAITACCRSCQGAAQRISSSTWFNLTVALVIVSNSIFLGFQLEMSLHIPDSREQSFAFLLGHLFYAILFTVEMLIRMVADGPRRYVAGPEWMWNWLDVLVVIPAWLELIVDFIDSEVAHNSSSNFRIIRVLRITRMLQVLRSVRLVRVIYAFRELVFSIIDTTRQLCWAMILLVLLIYSFGVLFTDAVLSHPHMEDIPQAAFYFGSVYKSCTTLFRTTLSGFDWNDAADSLLPVGMFWVQVFHVYVAFCGFAVLNVITGVFVNSAIKTREKDHDTLMLHVQKFKALATRIWQQMDSSGLGQITIDEFERMFADADMQAFFEALEITAIDAWTLFDSLDADGDHVISYNEFIDRCMQLHGNARSVDLFAVKQVSNKAG
ncbi:unnamed protein product [Effrenium voratum]|nr:unnamed protein product [Effrenium voratum]